MKTLAAILVAQGQPLVLDEVTLPPLKTGQALVEIRSTRVCGSQIGEIDGVKGHDRFLPHLLGHEAGGVVLETGPGTTRLSKGGRVVCHWRPGLGIDAGGSVYDWRSASVNAGPITTFQQLAVISENRLTPVPADTDFELCCLLADTLTTGLGIVENEARVVPGESVVVFGAGGIGLGVILAAKLAGAKTVIAVDIHPHKLTTALRQGATHAIDAGREDTAAKVTSILGGLADVTVDGTGNPKVIELAYELTRLRGGRCILFGVMPHGERVHLHTLPLHQGRVLTGTEGGRSQPHLDIPRLQDWIASGKLGVDGLVSHRVPLTQINSLIESMRRGEVIHGIVQC